MWFAELIAQQVTDVGTQTALARRLGVTQQTVSNWLTGKTLPQPPEAVRLAVHLGVDPVTFVGRLWPEVDQADPLRRLRNVLAHATPAQLEQVQELAQQVVEVSPATKAPIRKLRGAASPRSSSVVSRRSQPADGSPRPQRRSKGPSK